MTDTQTSTVPAPAAPESPDNTAGNRRSCCGTCRGDCHDRDDNAGRGKTWWSQALDADKVAGLPEIRPVDSWARLVALLGTFDIPADRRDLTAENLAQIARDAGGHNRDKPGFAERAG